jgi:hypothetical protein
LSLKPYPGSDGATTWKASAGSPPCAAGSLSGPITFMNSTVDPGQPCVITSGKAFGSGERAWMKWKPRVSSLPPVSSVRNCGNWLRCFSRDRQS